MNAKNTMRPSIRFLLHAGVIVLVTTSSGLSQDVFPLRPSEAKARGVASAGKAEEPEFGEGAIVKYVIASGDNLNKIAVSGYGRAGYWRLLKLYNACDPEKLKIGQVIEVPELTWWLEEEGIVPLFKDAAEALMEGRTLFMEAEDMLLAAGEGTEVSSSEDVVGKIVAAQKLLTQAREAFGSEREGVEGVPTSTLLQLRTAAELMGEVAQNPGKAQKEMAEVHERLGNALTYCIIWAREGFK